MTTPSTTRALILAVAAVASLMLASSLPAAAAAQGARMAVGARATVYTNPNRVIRDHRRDARCKWIGRHYCSLRSPP